MIIALDHRVLDRTTRELFHRELALRDGLAIPPPDTGDSSALTAAGLDLLTGRVRAVAVELHGLAEALDRFVERASGTDARVAGVLDLLLAGGLR